MLPGVPQLFRLQLEAVLSRWDGKPLALQCLYLSRPEADIARVLDEVALAMPEVAIGSYPTFDKALGYKVKVTVEHEDAARVARAVAALKSQLPPESIVREE
jgi:molybdopterin-biosynthesis enzyme MoeA-like protein